MSVWFIKGLFFTRLKDQAKKVEIIMWGLSACKVHQIFFEIENLLWVFNFLRSLQSLKRKMYGIYNNIWKTWEKRAFGGKLRKKWFVLTLARIQLLKRKIQLSNERDQCFPASRLLRGKFVLSGLTSGGRELNFLFFEQD